ncbi:hypothetical protein [Acinetobacter wuhouensis]|uniref:Uncharacterized protein n=1 Tax=Acinetobacter wuhouensis TaxID=1879050 RepID=A0A4V2DND3_9GAMM|nr:hypothetical protein [Acinetobacter wuhouensis]RZG48074.1 hypothetical protein EXU28_04715 [Acinetobacter wuhouensis]
MANTTFDQRIAQAMAVYTTLILFPIALNPSSKLDFNELLSLGKVLRHFTDVLFIFLMGN